MKSTLTPKGAREPECTCSTYRRTGRGLLYGLLGGCASLCIQGYLTHKKTHPPRTLPQAYAQGPRGFLGGWAFSYERGTLVLYGLLGSCASLCKVEIVNRASVHLSPFGVVTGWCPYVLSDFPRWREVVVFAN